MFDLQIRPAGRNCALTGEAFEHGEGVVSYLLPGKGEYVRIDVAARVAGSFTPPEIPVCRWNWEFRTPEDPAREAARSALAQSDELFLALCNADARDDPPQVLEERAALRHLLGLMLQRKRLLKPLAGGGDRFLHVASNQEVQVPPVKMTPQLLQKVAAQMNHWKAEG